MRPSARATLFGLETALCCISIVARADDAGTSAAGADVPNSSAATGTQLLPFVGTLVRGSAASDPAAHHLEVRGRELRPIGPRALRHGVTLAAVRRNVVGELAPEEAFVGTPGLDP